MPSHGTMLECVLECSSNKAKALKTYLELRAMIEMDLGKSKDENSSPLKIL